MKEMLLTSQEEKQQNLFEHQFLRYECFQYLTHVSENLQESFLPLRLYANAAAVCWVSERRLCYQERRDCQSAGKRFGNVRMWILWSPSQQLYHSVIYFNITQIFRTVLFQSGQQHSSSFSLKFSASLILLLLRLFLSPALTELVWIRVSSSTSPPISAISSRTCWFNSSSSHPERRLHNSANSTPAPPD